MNKVFLTGHLGADAELKYTQNQTPVANFSMATTKKWGKGEDSKEKTIWHTVNIWGKTAENIYQFLKKGKKVSLMGEIDENKWEDKEGNKRSRTIIISHEIEFMGESKPAEVPNPKNWQDTDSYVHHDDMPF